AIHGQAAVGTNGDRQRCAAAVDRSVQGQGVKGTFGDRGSAHHAVNVIAHGEGTKTAAEGECASGGRSHVAEHKTSPTKPVSSEGTLEINAADVQFGGREGGDIVDHGVYVGS